MRILLFNCLFLLPGLYLKAQSDTSAQLFWFKGRMAKANQLMTPNGDTVTYFPGRSVITVSADKKKKTAPAYDEMKLELGKTSQRLKEMMKRLEKLPKPVLPYTSLALKAAYISVHEEYTRILDNTITLPSLSDPNAAVPVVSLPQGNPKADYEAAFKEFNRYFVEHARDNLEIVPVPPSFRYEYCYNCQQEDFRQQMEKFREELAGPDASMLKKALALARMAQGDKLSVDRYKWVMGETERMIRYLMDRLAKRVLVVIHKYREQPDKIKAVLNVALVVSRSQKLMGFETEENRLPPDIIERSMMVIRKHLLQAQQQRDYPVALNMQVMFSVNRQMQILGLEPGNLVDQYFGFNQFRMDGHIAAKVEGNGGYLAAELTGKNWYVAIPDSVCQLQWIQLGPDINKASFDLQKAEWRGHGGDIPYVGTDKWVSDIPRMRLDFCSEEKEDTIVAYPFHAKNFEEKWKLPPPTGVVALTELNAVLTGCFIDPDRTKEEAAYFKDPANQEKIKKEMMAQYNKMVADFGKGKIKAPATLDMNDLAKYASLQQVNRNVTDLIHIADPGRFIFTPQLHNKEEIVLLDKINGKELFPQNTATEYAWYEIKLSHDPEGPYRIKLY